MYMEIFHVYGDFVYMYLEICPCIWRFCFHVYGGFPCIWKYSMYVESLFMYMEVLHPCIWKFFMYIESISMHKEEIFLLFQDGDSRVWNDLPSTRMSDFSFLPDI